MPSSDTQFKKGNKKGKGRPKGARNKLTQAYIKLLRDVFDDKGQRALDSIVETRPEVFLKLVSQLVPKDFDVKHSGDVTIQIVDYADIDKQADSERTASDGPVPISLVE